MRTFFLMLGLPDLAMTQMLVIVALAWACAFALGWISDAILGDGAYGVFVNAMIVIAGAIIGLLLWHRYGYGPMANTAQTKALVATSSGIAMLIVGGLLRRWI